MDEPGATEDVQQHCRRDSARQPHSSIREMGALPNAFIFRSSRGPFQPSSRCPLAAVKPKRQSMPQAAREDVLLTAAKDCAEEEEKRCCGWMENRRGVS